MFVQESKGYVFVSHSHKDLEIVRKIRNRLEENDFDPILFYLHCMENPTSEEAKELERLIHKEIDSREYFLYAKSENSQKSKWVQDELNYIESTKPSCVKKLDIQKDFDSVIKELDSIIHSRRVFVSYAHTDTDIGENITDALGRAGFAVWHNQIMPSGQSWQETTANAIHSSDVHIIILSEDYVKSETCYQEALFIINYCKSLVKPLYIIKLGDFNIENNKLFLFISEWQWMFFSENPTQGDIKYLISILSGHTIDCPWGPARAVFSNEDERPTYHVFNSYLDNPTLGDERNFCRIRNIKDNIWTNSISVVSGNKYEVIIYYHNNSGDNLQENVSKFANDVKVKCNFPNVVEKDSTATINAKISSSNTNPKSVWSGCYLTSVEACKLEYVNDTAKIYNGGELNGQSIGPAYLFSDGSTIGYNKISGKIPGGLEYAGHIKFQIHASSC